MNLSKEKFLIKRHSERSHAVAKSKNLGSCVIASLVRGVAISCLLFLAACSDDPKVGGGTEEDSGIIAIADKTVSGVSQKGPFVNGSSVTVYGLDGETLAQTGNIYEGKIKSDMGDFSVKVVKLASQYALLKANGFYRNEVTGEKSNSQMTLYALTDLSDRDEVNVNLLTHLAYERSLYLATDSLSVSKAKKQAEAEVFKSFEIEGDFGVAEDLNIFGENDQSAALLAISVLMQGDLKEADFSERLDNYARDIEEDGKWDDKKTATAIADWASEKSLGGGLATIRANVEKWGQLFGVPPFEKFVNNFWWQSYGLKTCDAKREGEILQASNPLSANNGVHFICNNGGWRVATDLEKDTYKWKTGKDADVKFGDVIKTNCYVFEDKAWRSGNDSDCSLNLRGCTVLRQDAIGEGSDKVWYVCDSRRWRDATTSEIDTYVDTYSEKCTSDDIGKTISGMMTATNKYYCTANGWVNLLDGWSWDIPKEARQNAKTTYSTMTDSRDKKVYKTVKIGDQVWMAENLNYADSSTTLSLKGNSWCYDNKPENCSVAGRLYTWAAAIDSVKLYKDKSIDCGYNKTCTLPDTVYGICPPGWHLPTNAEWNTLVNEFGGDSMAVNVLKSQTGWVDGGNGTDSVGFSALSAGWKLGSVEAYIDDGIRACFWSSTEDGRNNDSNTAYSIDLHFSNDPDYLRGREKTDGLSVRCLQD